MQEESAERIAREMKRLRLIPQSWRPNDAQQTTPSTVRPASTRKGPGTGQNGGRNWGGGEEGKTAQPEKLGQLREYLRNIEEIPVRRVRASQCSPHPTSLPCGLAHATACTLFLPFHSSPCETVQ